MTVERRIRISADESAGDPRTDWDCNVGRMICWHSRYNLGDKHDYNADTFIRELAFEHDSDVDDQVYRYENAFYERLWDRAADNGCDNYDDRLAYVERLVRPRINALIEKALSDGYVILPIYMYDHSGIGYCS